MAPDPVYQQAYVFAITIVMFVIVPLIMALGFLISGIRFETGSIPMVHKRRYVRKGTLPDLPVGPDLRGLLFRGKESHFPIGLGLLCWAVADLIQYIVYGEITSEAKLVNVGLFLLFIFTVIGISRSLFKGLLEPGWARRLRQAESGKLRTKSKL